MSVVPYPVLHGRSSSFVPRPSYQYTVMTSGAIKGRCISTQPVYDVRLTHPASDPTIIDTLADHYYAHAADYVQVSYAGHLFELRYQGPPVPRMAAPGVYDIDTVLIGHRVSSVSGWDTTLESLRGELLGLWRGEEGPAGGTSATDGAPPALNAVAAWPLPYSHESTAQARPPWLFDPMTDSQIVGRRDATRDVVDITLVHPMITQQELDNLLYHYQRHQRDVIRLCYAGSVYDAHYLGEPEPKAVRGPWREATVRLIGTRVASALALTAMTDAINALIDAVYPPIAELLIADGQALIDAGGYALTTQRRELAQ